MGHGLGTIAVEPILGRGPARTRQRLDQCSGQGAHVVDRHERAVLAALEGGHLAGAGLDCWDREPQPPLDNPLLHHKAVLASPHTAGVTEESRRRIATWGAEQLIGLFVRGERPPRLVNPAAWPAFAQRFSAMFGRDVEARLAAE